MMAGLVRIISVVLVISATSVRSSAEGPVYCGLVLSESNYDLLTGESHILKVLLE